MRCYSCRNGISFSGRERNPTHLHPPINWGQSDLPLCSPQLELCVYFRRLFCRDICVLFQFYFISPGSDGELFIVILKVTSLSNLFISLIWHQSNYQGSTSNIQFVWQKWCPEGISITSNSYIFIWQKSKKSLT